MPVVLNSVLDAVTKITAIRLPSRSGNAVPGIAGELVRVPGQHEGRRRRRLKGPAGRARLSGEMPMIQNARCATITPPIRMIGRPNGLRERCQVRYSTSAIAQAAASSDMVTILAN